MSAGERVPSPASDDPRPLRLRVRYSDHNESFAVHLPRTGTLERSLQSTAGDLWLLFVLDEPFELQLGEWGRWRLAHVDAFLLRERWQGQRIGESDDVAVHILLVEKAGHPKADTFEVRDFVHIAWGSCDRA